MATIAGFEPARFEDISRQVKRTWSICTRRFLGKLAVDRSYRQLALSTTTRNRDFILSLPRLMAAYATRAMRYGVFTFDRPCDLRSEISLRSTRCSLIPTRTNERGIQT